MGYGWLICKDTKQSMKSAALKFLVVDEFPTMRRIIRGWLMQIGRVTGTIDETEDGVQALRRIEAGGMPTATRAAWHWCCAMCCPRA